MIVQSAACRVSKHRDLTVQLGQSIAAGGNVVKDKRIFSSAVAAAVLFCSQSGVETQYRLIQAPSHHLCT